MSKIDINKAAEIVKKNVDDPSTVRAIIEDMNLLVSPEADEQKPPALKKQFAIVVSDSNGVMPETDLVGWVLQLPENESVATTLERIHRGAYEFNTTKKGRLLPVKTIGEALENVPAKHFKEAQVWVKTKTPVLIVRTNNRIPMEAKEAA